jgi:hypothetical protein
VLGGNILYDVVFPCFELQRRVKALLSLLSLAQHDSHFTSLLFRVPLGKGNALASRAKALGLAGGVVSIYFLASRLEHFLDACESI